MKRNRIPAVALTIALVISLLVLPAQASGPAPAKADHVLRTDTVSVVCDGYDFNLADVFLGDGSTPQFEIVDPGSTVYSSVRTNLPNYSFVPGTQPETVTLHVTLPEDALYNALDTTVTVVVKEKQSGNLSIYSSEYNSSRSLPARDIVQYSESFGLKYSTTKSGSTTSINWSVDNSDILQKTNESGIYVYFMPVGVGTATVTATYTYDGEAVTQTHTVTVVPRVLTIAGLDAVNRNYEPGNFTVELDASQVKITGILSSDDVSVQYMPGTIADDSACTSSIERIVTPHAALAGADKDKYAIRFDSKQFGAYISPLVPTIAAIPSLNAVYGQKLGDLEIPNPEGNTPGIWTFEYPTIVLNSVGSTTYRAKFTPDEYPNIGRTWNDITVTVAKAAQSPVISSPLYLFKGEQFDLSKLVSRYAGSLRFTVTDGTASGSVISYMFTASDTAGDVKVRVKAFGNASYNEWTSDDDAIVIHVIDAYPATLTGTVEDGAVCYEVPDLKQPAKLIAARFEGGKMAEVKVITLTESGSGSTGLNYSSGSTYRLFLLDDILMLPLCDAVELT